MKLLHTTGQVIHCTDTAVFYLLKNGYVMNDNGKLKTDAAPGYIEYLTRNMK